MRRMLVGLTLCLGIVLGVAGVATAQSYPPQPGPGISVGGISATRSSASTSGSGASTSGSGRLAFTGSNGTSTLVWVGGGLALAGGVIVVMSYRRRSSLHA